MVLPGWGHGSSSPEDKHDIILCMKLTLRQPRDGCHTAHMFSCGVPGAIQVQLETRVHSAGGHRGLAQRVQGGEPLRAGPMAEGSLPPLPSPEHISQCGEGTLCGSHKVYFIHVSCTISVCQHVTCASSLVTLVWIPCLSSAGSYAPGLSSEPVLKLLQLFCGCWKLVL